MLREQARVFTGAHRALDISLTVAAFIGAYMIKKDLLPAPFGGLVQKPNYYLILLMIIIIWYLSFAMFDLYAPYRKQDFGRIFRNMFKAVSVGMIVLIVCMYFFKMTDISRIMLGLFFILNVGLLGSSKGLVYWILARYRRRGLNFRNVLIVGSRERARNIIDAIGDNLGSGYTVMGCLDPDESYVGKKVRDDIRVIGTVDQLQEILTGQVVDELIFAVPAKKIEDVGKYILLATQVGVSVHMIPDWHIAEIQSIPGIVSPRFRNFLGIPALSLVTTPNHRAEMLIKNVFDYTSAVALSILFLPIFLLIVVAIKVSSRGPVFFRQERSGLNGRRFMLYKFRTMVDDAEARRGELEGLNETDGPVFKIKNDPRIIPYVGTFLRKTSLDELPQLINILRGEMSFIGPRPPIPAEVEQYDLWQRRRLSMKPGLTCIWQCTPNRNDVDFESWMRMDLCYIDTWSLRLDAKLFLKTIQVVLLGSGR
ncbi:MAG: sugar transferase [Syntrophaceae bacterium]|nr:sugar transferase [Syntrophaceae bacterium]